MDQIVNLSTGKTFDILKEFPTIDAGSKIAIMFTGGVESYLVAHIAKQLYGIENIVFVIILAGQYGDFSASPDKREKVKRDFYNGVKRLGGFHTYEIDESAFTGSDFAYNLALNKLKENFPSIEHVFSGSSNLQRESMLMLLDCGWDKGKLAIDDVKVFFENHKDNYPELKKYIEDFNGDLFFLIVGFEQIQYYYYRVISPLYNLTSPEVVEVYKNLGILDQLFGTTSCNRSISVQHCGVCKSCLARKSSIEQNDINDLTVYG